MAINRKFQVNVSPAAILAARKRLGQSLPSVTTPVTAWTNPYFGQYNIDLIHAVNVSSTENVSIWIWHDPAGSTYDDNNVLVDEYVLGPGDVFQLFGEGGIADYQDGGTIGVKASLANSVNFKVYGTIESETVQPT